MEQRGEQMVVVMINEIPSPKRVGVVGMKI